MEINNSFYKYLFILIKYFQKENLSKYNLNQLKNLNNFIEKLF